MDGNRELVFICNRRKYLDDDEGIKNYFAAFNLHDSFPVSVIIDEFGDFFDERNCQERYSSYRGKVKDLAMVRILALCHKAMALDNFSLGKAITLDPRYHFTGQKNSC